MKDSIYKGVSEDSFQIELRRLQLQLLKIQRKAVKNKKRIAIVFEGRDAAGKGATIKRFVENMMPSHYKVVALGVPTPQEMQNWFERYENYLPNEGEIVFFDRSWYSRALIQPVMDYCSRSDYSSFMESVNLWEKAQIDNGTTIIKIYLSVSREIQTERFHKRLNCNLSEWKFSENDLKSRDRWDLMTEYENLMFAQTSIKQASWKNINANVRFESVLDSMLYVVKKLSRGFVPLTGEDITKTYSVKVAGVKFRGLNAQQHAVLKELKANEHRFVDLEN